MDRLGAVMEEYKTLRQESLSAIDRQERVLASGTAVSGVVLGLGARASPGSSVSVVLLLVLAPGLGWLITIMWLGEVERMVRAGAYVSLIEQRVNKELGGGDAALGWESFLRREAPGGRRILWVYRAVFGILWLVAVAAAVVGCIGVVKHGALLTAVAGVVVGIILSFLLCFYIGSEMRLRAMGGKTWSGRPPLLMRLVGGAPTVVSEGVSKTEQPVTRGAG